MAERAQRDPDIAAVRELLWKWDFAGLGDTRATTPDQYDGLCARLIPRVKESPDASRAWLARELAENWALDIPAWAIDGFVTEVEGVVRTESARGYD